MTEQNRIDIHGIRTILPHRYPFLLIDRVLEYQPHDYLKAIKNVSVNEPFFSGHFPARPVFPGVLILEAIAQASAILASRGLDEEPDENTIFLFAGIDKARFKRPVEPGDQLLIEVTQTNFKNKVWKCSGKARWTVDYARLRTFCSPTASFNLVTRIHPSAIVDAGAQLGKDVVVEAFSIIEKHVVIEDHTHVGPHVIIRDHTTIGAHCRLFQFCSIGEIPQHTNYHGELTRLQIGDRNTIREYCTLNRGTAEGLGVTTLGDENFIMAYTHIAHDCTIGNHTTFANGASLAGHVEVGDYAILGGFSLVHQYCNIGAHSITGIGTTCFQDVPPYIVAAGQNASPFGINTKGLRRRNYHRETIALLKKAYRLLYRSNLDFNSAIAAIEKLDRNNSEISIFCDFLRRSERGIIR